MDDTAALTKGRGAEGTASHRLSSPGTGQFRSRGRVRATKPATEVGPRRSWSGDARTWSPPTESAVPASPRRRRSAGPRRSALKVDQEGHFIEHVTSRSDGSSPTSHHGWWRPPRRVPSLPHALLPSLGSHPVCSLPCTNSRSPGRSLADRLGIPDRAAVTGHAQGPRWWPAPGLPRPGLIGRVGSSPGTCLIRCAVGGGDSRGLRAGVQYRGAVQTSRVPPPPGRSMVQLPPTFAARAARR